MSSAVKGQSPISGAKGDYIIYPIEAQKEGNLHPDDDTFRTSSKSDWGAPSISLAVTDISDSSRQNPILKYTTNPIAVAGKKPWLPTQVLIRGVEPAPSYPDQILTGSTLSRSA